MGGFILQYLINSEERQTQTLVELAEVLLTGGKEVWQEGCAYVCICRALPIS